MALTASIPASSSPNSISAAAQNLRLLERSFDVVGLLHSNICSAVKRLLKHFKDLQHAENRRCRETEALLRQAALVLSEGQTVRPTAPFAGRAENASASLLLEH